MTTTNKADQHVCAAFVSRDSWHSYHCSKPPTVTAAGKRWCAQHNPEKVDARRAAAEAAEVLGRQLQEARWARQQAERAALAVLCDWPLYANGDSLTAVRNDLQAAMRAEAKALKAAQANGKVRAIFFS